MSPARRVLVLTADAGFGHRSAANAIAACLRETHGSECSVEVVNPLADPRVPSFLRSSQADYDRMVREMPNLYELGYQASEAEVPGTIVESALTVLLFEVMRDLVRRHQPNAIVTTYPLYQAPLSAVFAVAGQAIPLLTVVTDLVTVHRLWFNRAADCCLVPTATARDLALGHGLPPERVFVTGLPVHPNFAREDRPPRAVRAELGWEESLRAILIVGGRRVVDLQAMLRVLNHSGLPLQLAVVAGGDDALYEHLQSVDWHLRAHTYNFVRNMSAVMHAADLVVCKAGGLIVAEALACGLPLVLVDALPGQETGNSAFVVAGGAGERADDPVGVLEVLCHWLEHGGEQLGVRAESARRLGRPRAAYEVAEQTWTAALREPTARPRLHGHWPGRVRDLLTRFEAP